MHQPDFDTGQFEQEFQRAVAACTELSEDEARRAYAALQGGARMPCYGK